MLNELAHLLLRWQPLFRQRITWVRLISVLLGLIVAYGRRTVTSSITIRGRQSEPWAADYLVFSRASWEVEGLFDGVVDASIDTLDRFCTRGRYLLVAIDDTSLPKTGKKIAAARWMRDPMSPPFQVNLRWGLRYVHLAMILPLNELGFDPRVVSIDFALAPSIKKPGAKATDEEVANYKEIKKKKNMSIVAVERFTHLRKHLDATGQHSRTVLMIGDGSYTNRNVLKNLPERTEYIGRTRGDLAIYAAAPAGGRKVYGERLPTPNELRKDEKVPWIHTELFYAGEKRKVRYKELKQVLWQTGGQRKLLRIFVIAPTPYRAYCNGRGRTYYREPAYLLTTDRDSPADELIQPYLARWQIEVEHRDQKTGLGVGHAQVSNDKSVERLHAAHVAMWSMVKLAALRTFGLTRTAAYPERPAWYPQEPGQRASQTDIVCALRAELQRQPPAKKRTIIRSNLQKRMKPLRKKQKMVAMAGAG